MELTSNEKIILLLKQCKRLKRREIKEFEFSAPVNNNFSKFEEITADGIEICVADVGQGSTNFIKNGTNLTIFDFGTSIYAKKIDMHNIISMHSPYFINSCKIFLVISHWDCDHYNLLTAVDDKFLKNIFCAYIPDKYITLTSKNVVNRLTCNCKKIVFFSSPVKKGKKSGMQSIFKSKSYEFFIGEKDNKKNKSGLALVVYGSHSSIVFSADHTNYQIWNCMYPNIEKKSVFHIVIPHHGGNCGKIMTKSIYPEKAGKAIVSVGKNFYRHPSQKTLDMYLTLGFEVIRTDWERHDVIISLK